MKAREVVERADLANWVILLPSNRLQSIEFTVWDTARLTNDEKTVALEVFSTHGHRIAYRIIGLDSRLELLNRTYWGMRLR